MSPLPQRKDHPLKANLRNAGIKLWQVAFVSGRSPASLADYLNGTRPMPIKVQEAAERLLEEVRHES
jgi:hypothetical protein